MADAETTDTPMEKELNKQHIIPLPFTKEVNDFTKSSLTHELGADILFKSFRFSQGNVDTQKNIFIYLHLIAPNWKMDEDLKKKILEISLPKIEAFLRPTNQKTRHSGRVLDIPEGTIEELGVMQTTMNGDPEAYEQHNLDESTILLHIADGIIMSDYEFLVENGGRPNHPDNSNTKFFSYFRYYILQEHPTGNPFFDRMFNDIRIMWEQKDDPDLRWSIEPTEVITKRGLERPIEALEELAEVWK